MQSIFAVQYQWVAWFDSLRDTKELNESAEFSRRPLEMGLWLQRHREELPDRSLALAGADFIGHQACCDLKSQG
jgi:hypothetical protein